METVFLSLSKSDLQDLIAETVNSCLKRNLDPQTPPPNTDQWLDLTELCKYHPDKPSKATAYGWVHAGTIPVHKSSKKLRFLKSEIDAWLKQGRKKTNAEAATEANAYLQSKKKKG